MTIETKVIDGFFADQAQLLPAIVDRYVNRRGMKYGWQAINRGFDQGHWNVPISLGSSFIPADISAFPWFEQNNPEVAWLWKKINQTIPSQTGHPRTLVRAYINGYTFGTDGYAHRDDPWIKDKHGVESETFIIYLNDRWDKNWAGETVVYTEDGEIEKSVLPKLGRILIFDSSKEHAARPLSRIYQGLRLIMTFKTADARINSAALAYIENLTKNINHCGQPFFRHLYNTALILERARMPDYVVLAGLYHSIYGTEYFNPPISVTREKVAELIGNQAEDLVHIFCTIENRIETILQDWSFDFEKRYYLLHIELANVQEQRDRAADKVLCTTIIENVQKEIAKLKPQMDKLSSDKQATEVRATNE
jgi:SM-20-related protein